jgi:hypothetical protein
VTRMAHARCTDHSTGANFGLWFRHATQAEAAARRPTSKSNSFIDMAREVGADMTREVGADSPLPPIGRDRCAARVPRTSREGPALHLGKIQTALLGRITPPLTAVSVTARSKPWANSPRHALSVVLRC